MFFKLIEPFNLDITYMRIKYISMSIIKSQMVYNSQTREFYNLNLLGMKIQNANILQHTIHSGKYNIDIANEIINLFIHIYVIKIHIALIQLFLQS